MNDPSRAAHPGGSAVSVPLSISAGTILPRPERGWSMRVGDDEGITRWMTHASPCFHICVSISSGMRVRKFTVASKQHRFWTETFWCCNSKQTIMQRNWSVPTQISFRLWPEKVGPKTMAQKTRSGKLVKWKTMKNFYKWTLMLLFFNFNTRHTQWFWRVRHV